MPKQQRRQVALVTGSRSGIGAETCFALREIGLDIIALDRRYDPGVHTHPDGLLVGADVSDAEEMRSLWPSIIEYSGPIKYLVNSAGVQETAGLPWETDLDKLADTFMTNSLGPLLMIGLAVENMPTGGVIINIASYAGIDGYSEYAAYSMSKGSLFSLARTLRGPLSLRGLKLTTLVPGPAATPMQFQDTAWPVLLNPATVAQTIVDCLIKPKAVSIEEIWIRAVGDGETRPASGVQSRTWPTALLRCSDKESYRSLFCGQASGRSALEWSWIEGRSRGTLPLPRRAATVGENAASNHSQSVLASRLGRQTAVPIVAATSARTRAHRECAMLCTHAGIQQLPR